MLAQSQFSLLHLQAELMRIDLMLHRACRRWRLSGQDPSDTFRGLYINDDEVDALLKRPFRANWGDLAALPSEVEEAYGRAFEKAQKHVDAVAAGAERRGQRLGLQHLAETFGLDRFDYDALLICLAPTLDRRYERLYGYLQDDVTCKRPSVDLILNLLGAPGVDRVLQYAHFDDCAPLFSHQLLQRGAEAAAGQLPLLIQTLLVEPSIVAWLRGEYQPAAALGSHARLTWPMAAEAELLLDDEVRPTLVRAIERQALLVCYGPDQSGQAAAASVLAAQSRQPLLTVDLAGAVARGLSPYQAVRLALRDARLMTAVPCLTQWEACLDEDAPQPEVFAEVCAYAGLVICSSRAAWRPAGLERYRDLLWAEFRVPRFAHRAALWRHFLGDSPPPAEFDLAALAGQFQLTTSQIRDAVVSAKNLAMQRGGVFEGEDLFAAARAHSGSGLSSLARKIAPRYTWQDIILPDDQVMLLQEIVSTVRGRSVVMDEWGVGRKLASSTGVMVLFAGPPGTGKTMAAEVISGELGLDLYKIDLSTIVSKYIGDTEKNLERVFVAAECSNAILFFDEADAIFGKRSEVRDSHDRYANIEISYLLQRMEAYDGVTILATNLRANLDEAFTRRLQFVVDFPFPETPDRLRMWETLFPQDVPRVPDLDFGLLAKRFKLAGGSIRNIIVHAAFLAAADGGRVTMDHLLHSARRELQKMGRLIRETDVELTDRE